MFDGDTARGGVRFTPAAKYFAEQDRALQNFKRIEFCIIIRTQKASIQTTTRLT